MGDPIHDDKYLLLLNELLIVDSGYIFGKKAEEETTQRSFMEGRKFSHQEMALLQPRKETDGYNMKKKGK